jgi:hypothetical protein
MARLLVPPRNNCIAVEGAFKPSAFDCSRVLGYAAGFLEYDKQRKQGESSDHQQLVIIDVSNDLGLWRDQGIERRSSGGVKWAQEVRDDRVFEGAIHCGDVGRDIGVIDLRAAGEHRVDNGNTHARADIARKIEKAGRRHV